jgi:hypothetical protein
MRIAIAAIFLSPVLTDRSSDLSLLIRPEAHYESRCHFFARHFFADCLDRTVIYLQGVTP